MHRFILIFILVILSVGTSQAADLTVTNVRLVIAPGESPIANAAIVIRDGKVLEVTTDEQVNAQASGTSVLDGGGRVATAGLWNCHVHFTDPNLTKNAADIVRDMLLAYGFTSVIDTGSFLEGTQRLATAIDQEKIEGPRILLANGSFVFTGGTPSYLPGIQLPEIGTPQDAAPVVDQVLDQGAHGIKIFSGSFMSPTETIHLPPDIIRAVKTAAHKRDAFVIAHPTDRTGLVNAIENGVDVLAHTAPPAGPLGKDVVSTMFKNNVALVPTLKLWAWELTRAGVPQLGVQQFQNAGVSQLKEFVTAGGEVLFGTDVGYMRDYDTREEFEMMARAGMDFDGILAALTTNPAQRFVGEAGRVEPGAPGDLVLFQGDPTSDVTELARVAFTVRGGQVVYDHSK